MSALTYVIFILVAVLACFLGSVGAYFYYQARHREAKAILEALDQDLTEREEEVHRRQFKMASVQPGDGSSVPAELDVEMQRLREELERKKNDYDLLKHDFDLEIDVLKKEVERIRDKRTGADQSHRQLSEMDAGLREREQRLVAREKELSARERRLSSREDQIEEEISARRKEVEERLAQRERQLQADLTSLGEERTELAEARGKLSEKESRLDEEFNRLPSERFTSDQEARLIKRLRQQIKLQRDELEVLQRQYHRTRQQLETRDAAERSEGAKIGESGAEPIEPVDEPPAPSKPTADAQPERSAYAAAAAETERPQTERPPRNGQRFDDLTCLPGLDGHLQQKLYRLGITTFDQIARWSSAEARGVAERLRIDGKTIQDHWIVNAQSHLSAKNPSES